MTRNESSFPGRLDDSRQYQRPEHFVTASGRLEPQHPVRPGQGNPQASHPRRRDGKWPTRCIGSKTEIELKLPPSHTQRRRRLQHREFSIVVC